MNKRPTNTLLAAVVGIISILVIYILGSFVIQMRRDQPVLDDASQVE